MSLQRSKSLYILLLCLSCSVFYHNVRGQNFTYARRVVDTLASPTMHGRGYVNGGDSLAAAFIAEEYLRLNLSVFGDSFSQRFEVKANTFPGLVTLGLNDRPMVPGVDFLVAPGCPRIFGSFKTTYLSAEDILDGNELFSKLTKAKGKFIIVDADEGNALSPEQKKAFNNNLNVIKYALDIPIPGIILLSTQKLTWSVAGVQDKRAIITVKKGAINGKIKNVVIDVEAHLEPYHSTQNVVGFIPGTKQPDSIVVLTAHYDHLGRMGTNTYFPGANDNASGIAMLLSFAEHFSKPENALDYTVVFIAFGAEELGLKGSQYFTQHPLFALEKIKFLINFDISGTGDDGIQVVNGSVFRKEFDRLQELNKTMGALEQVKIRGEACNSDHCFFYQKGVPSFFIYTLGGIQAYHDVNDKAETLPLTKYEDYFRLMTEWFSGL